jgi:hypothetical protein
MLTAFSTGAARSQRAFLARLVINPGLVHEGESARVQAWRRNGYFLS